MKTCFINQRKEVTGDEQETGFLSRRDGGVNRLSPLDKRCTGGQSITVIQDFNSGRNGLETSWVN